MAELISGDRIPLIGSALKPLAPERGVANDIDAPNVGQAQCALRKGITDDDGALEALHGLSTVLADTLATQQANRVTGLAFGIAQFRTAFVPASTFCVLVVITCEGEDGTGTACIGSTHKPLTP